MPFKSQAQRRKFAQLLVEGKISNQTFEEWNRETGSTKLPERVGSGRENSQENQEIAGTAENKPLIAAAIVSNGRAERRNPTRPMGFNVACVWSDRHDRQRR